MMADALGLLAVAACVGNGEVIPVKVALKPSAVGVAPSGGGGATVALLPFEDSRAERSRLGTRHSVWGSRMDFAPQGGGPGETTAQALASYLASKGWRAQYMTTSMAGDTDVVISGRILDLSVNANGSLGGTEVTAKNKLLVQAKNRADGSSLTETIGHSGNYHVFWFEQEDGEDILADVLEKNFEKFVANTKIDGKTIRFR